MSFPTPENYAKKNDYYVKLCYPAITRIGSGNES